MSCEIYDDTDDTSDTSDSEDEDSCEISNKDFFFQSASPEKSLYINRYPHLRYVDVSNNNLKCLNLKNWSNGIIFLKLSNNNIKTIKGNFPSSLRVLHLDLNPIELLNIEVFNKCNDLNNLYLNDTKLTEWNWDISVLRKLKSINLSYCNIKEFKWKNSPKTLTRISINGCTLKNFSFSDEIPENLEELYAYGISYKTDYFKWDNIPKTLNVLVLDRNNIDIFTWENCQSKNLKKIGISSCNIKKFTFENCPNRLKYMYCENNNFVLENKKIQCLLKNLTIDSIPNFEILPESIDNLYLDRINFDLDSKQYYKFIPTSIKNIYIKEKNIDILKYKKDIEYIKHNCLKFSEINKGIKNHFNIFTYLLSLLNGLLKMITCKYSNL